MDDIYGDLDNYNDVNIVEELKSENQELKTKLNEYTVAMDILQKEFDHLSVEFKKLEMNYSSLLKTAKSEIERKTQMIANLNLEKDKMVLNAIQNKNINPRSLFKNHVPERSKIRDSKLRHENKDEAVKEKYDPTKENVQNHRIPTVDTVSSSNTDISTKSQECKVSASKVHEKKLEFKENCKLAKAASSKSRLRRKSMSALRQEDLSSLSGDENNFLTKTYRKDSLALHDKQSKSHKKGSETSSVDDKYSSYKESSLETYHRSRHSKHYDSEKYQSNKNTYDGGRHRRATSPDHLLRRATRNCSGNQYSSYRYSESKTKYGHRSKSRDRRSNYDRQYDDRQTFSDHKTYDSYYDRQAYDDISDDRHSYSDRLPGKHKSYYEYDSYSSKRMRIDETQMRRDENVFQLEKNYTDEELFQKVIGDIQYTSCQSPDSMQLEHPPEETVKEIRLTSDLNLEDPRLKCGKYSLKSDSGTVKLIKTNEQDIDLIPIDKSVWNILDVPDALKKPPDQVKIDIKKNKNDKHEPSVPAESAKSPTLDDKLTKTTSNAVNTSDLKNAEENDSTNNLPSTETKSNSKELCNEGSDITKHGSKNIERERKSNKNHSSKQTKKFRKCSEKSSDEQNTLAMSQNKNEDCVSEAALKSNCKSDKSISGNNLLPVDNANSSQITDPTVNKKLSNREIVAGDLELSDEASDTTEFDIKEKLKNQTNEKSSSLEVHKHKKISNIHSKTVTDDCRDEPCKKVKNKVKMDIDKIPDTDKPLTDTKTENIAPINSTKLAESVSEQDTLQNETPKLQTDKQSNIENPSTSENEKSVTTDLKNNSDEKKKIKKTKPNVSKKITKTTESRTDKKKKAVKEKEFLSTPIKNKFTDLFGENSSLITPEDLGLTACQPELHASANYMPISEDAQDAMDIIVSVEEMACDQKEILNEIRTDTTNSLCIQGFSHDKINTEVSEQSKPNSGPEITDEENQKEIVNTLTIMPETAEPGVIKTVIISTGAQLQTNLKVSLPLPIAMEANKATIDAVNSLKALATSTPHKSFFDEEHKNPEISSNSNDSRTSSNNNIANDQSSKSMSEAQSEDAPDVRIVLKRKRRVIKK